MFNAKTPYTGSNFSCLNFPYSFANVPIMTDFGVPLMLSPGMSGQTGGNAANDYQYLSNTLPLLLACQRLQEQHQADFVSPSRHFLNASRANQDCKNRSLSSLNSSVDCLNSSANLTGLTSCADGPPNSDTSANSAAERPRSVGNAIPSSAQDNYTDECNNNIGQRKFDTPPPPPPPSNNPLSYPGFDFHLDVLSEQIWHYYMSNVQSDELLRRKMKLRDMLYYAIFQTFPMCGLYVVGSSLNGFGTSNSDMDLCLMIKHPDIDQRNEALLILERIKCELSHQPFIRTMQLIPAKVPILRINCNSPYEDITVDLNANNSVAIKNTHLLSFYSQFDWRVRPLVALVKEWARRRDINDATRSSFTSYSLVLMVIHYLQCGTSPSVLPSLQKIYRDRFNSNKDVRSLDVSRPLQPSAEHFWKFNNKTTLGELLIGFMDYYANKFNYNTQAISVRLGIRTDRARVVRSRNFVNLSNLSQWRCICIEEPFMMTNTAHSVHDEMVFNAIKQAFAHGYQQLDNDRDLEAFLNVEPIRRPSSSI